jgi:hypothetical protein
MNLPPYALWSLFTLLVIPAIFYFMKVSRDKHNASVAASKQEDEAISKWKSEILAIVVRLKTEIMKGRMIPSDWYPIFEMSMPKLSRLVAQIPIGLDSNQRSEIVTVVDGLCGMTDTQVVKGQYQVAKMLERLETLTLPPNAVRTTPAVPDIQEIR